MILHTESLYKTLSDRCKDAKRRIFIASPFVGDADNVDIIIGDVLRHDQALEEVLPQKKAIRIKRVSNV